MIALNKQALRKLAKALSGKEWVAFVHKASGTYAVGSLGHERGEDIIKWPGLDGQDNAESKAKFIATANPATMLALLDENLQLQRDKDSLEAVAIAMRDDMRDTREKLEAAEKRIAELEARTVTLPPTFWYEHDDLSRDIPVLDKRLVKKAIRAAGIGVKG